MTGSNRPTDRDTPERRAIKRRLQTIPNIGPAMADDLLRLGIGEPGDLAGRDPEELYDALGRLDGSRPDPCVLDTFMAAVAFAEGGPSRPWWTFTPERKARAHQLKGATTS